MSTSPSWFDQEKFSRLNKKKGQKNAHDVAPASPATPSPQPENSPAPFYPPPGSSQPLPEGIRPPSIQEPPREPSLASTANISLVSKPPSLLAEQRALPTLPRRTMPLPALKSLFPSAPAPIRASDSQPLPDAPSHDGPGSESILPQEPANDDRGGDMA